MLVICSPSSLYAADDVATLNIRHMDGIELGQGREPNARVTQNTAAHKPFSLNPSLRLQTLVESRRASGENIRHALSLRRARVKVSGHVAQKNIRYLVELAFSPTDLRIETDASGRRLQASPLLSWYWQWDWARDVQLRVGQYKIPFSRQRVISSGKQQLVDRSLVQSEFNLDRDVGFDIRSSDLFGLGFLRYALGAYNGRGRDVASIDEGAPMFLGRLEIHPFGFYDDMREGDLKRHRRPRLSVSSAFAYTERGYASRINRGERIAFENAQPKHIWTADVQLKYRGMSLSGEAYQRQTMVTKSVSDEPSRDGYGWFMQGGVMLLKKMPLEFSARYGEIRPTDALSALPRQNEIGAGLSYYFSEHRYKIQADYFHIEQEQSADEHVVRAQLQLAI